MLNHALTLRQGCVALAVSIAAMNTAAQGTDADARLEAVRQALAERALQSASRLRSVAWVDEHGTLHENVEVRSNVRLRGVRILDYLKDGEGEQANVVAVALEQVRRECPGQGTSLRRPAALEVNVDPQDGRSAQSQLPEIAQRMREGLAGRLQADPGWLVSREAVRRSPYERLLFEPQAGATTTPYLLQLSVESATPTRAEGVLAQTGRWLVSHYLSGAALPVAVRLRLALRERTSGRVLWQDTKLVELPALGLTGVRAPLAAATLDQLEQVLAGWQDSLRQAVSCEPLQVALSGNDDRIELPGAGSLAGVRVGDRWLRIDPQWLPDRLFDAVAMQGTALLQVESVTAHAAVLRRVAGPPAARPLASLVAIPF